MCRTIALCAAQTLCVFSLVAQIYEAPQRHRNKDSGPRAARFHQLFEIEDKRLNYLMDSRAHLRYGTNSNAS
jgi:hypothetical protein